MNKHNVANPEDVKAQRDREKIERKQEKLDWEWLLQQGPGRRIVWRLMEECRIYEESFTGHANTTFVNEGMRKIGLSIIQKVIRARPDALTEMMIESKKREEALNG